MKILIKKIFLFFIFLLFANPNTSYAKLIEFEKCYNSENIFNSSETEYEKIENVNWSEDYYKIRYTLLYHPFDPKKYENILSSGKKTGNIMFESWINFTNNELGPKIIKNILKEIKKREKEGFIKVFPHSESYYSISTTNNIITATKIFTDDAMNGYSHHEAWDKFNQKKKGEQFSPWNLDKISNTKYKIDTYSGGIIQATDINSKNYKVVINLKNNTVINIREYVAANGRIFKNETFLICKPLSASKKNTNYTQYWWAIILIAAVIFFIYTQTGRELKIKK